MGTTSNSKRSTRSRTRRRAPAALAVVAACAIALVAGSTAWAAPLFSDVPVDHPFYAEIQWMGETGISNGYPDGTYRPNEPVSRAAMSAFMERMFNLGDYTRAATDGTAHTTSSETWSEVPLSRDVSIPDGTSARITAEFSTESLCSGGDGFCRARLMLQPDGGVPVELTPAVSGDCAFDSGDDNTEGTHSWEARSMTRTTGSPVGTGAYRVYVEFAVSKDAGLDFRVDDSLLQVRVDLLPNLSLV